jgi:hypothetical protein
MFVGMHAALAAATHVDELAITMDQGAAFMEAAGNVARHYAIQTTQKTMDWIAFAGVAAGLYVPKILAINAKRAAQQQAPQHHNGGAEVLDMTTLIRPNGADYAN